MELGVIAIVAYPVRIHSKNTHGGSIMTEGTTRKEQRLLEREERLKAQLEQTRAALRARQARRDAAERKKQRADDARRVFVLGRWLMDGERWRGYLDALDEFIVRDADRELFGLPPQNREKEDNATE